MVPGVWPAVSVPLGWPTGSSFGFFPHGVSLLPGPSRKVSLYWCAPLKVSTTCPFLASLVGLATGPTPSRKEDNENTLSWGGGMCPEGLRKETGGRTYSKGGEATIPRTPDLPWGILFLVLHLPLP